METANEITYPMKATCLLSGLPPDTLRAWERRYGAVTPQRRNGRRLYSQADVQRLKLLKWAVDHGHRISQVASMDDGEIQRLQERHPESVALQALEPAHVDRVIGLIKEFRLEADIELGKLASLMPPRQFVFDVVLPMMRQIGSEWEDGSLSIAQEHLTSAAVRNILGTLVRIYGVNGQAPAILCTTPPGELHEFGALIGAMIASIHGFRALYFGANLPLSEIANAAERARALAVLVGVNHASEALPPIAETAQALRALLPHKIQLIVGGNQCHQVPVQRAPSIHAAPTFEILERLLLDLKDRSGAFSPQ